MHLKKSIIDYLHLDKTYSLMTCRSVNILLVFFKSIDIHMRGGLNDIQFYAVLHHMTDLTRFQIEKVFDMLDVDGSGTIEFDEFYLLMSILIATRDEQEKQFIFRHSRTVFDLLDEDASESVSAEEFNSVGFMFNFQDKAIGGIFAEFDVSGDQELDYGEFKMFSMACIDRQRELDLADRRKQMEQDQAKVLRDRKEKVDYIIQQRGFEFLEMLKCADKMADKKENVVRSHHSISSLIHRKSKSE
ncbi:hypothetical protein SNEBB_008782 [Seison nebaliae]|nr:hypothetical protein SNEBB_008782 [Seison nebaliae]